jgi:hypothetical protein
MPFHNCLAEKNIGIKQSSLTFQDRPHRYHVRFTISWDYPLVVTAFEVLTDHLTQVVWQDPRKTFQRLCRLNVASFETSPFVSKTNSHCSPKTVHQILTQFPETVR